MRIYWTDTEKRALARHAASALRQANLGPTDATHGPTLLRLLRSAQLDVLPTNRHRTIDQACVFSWFPDVVSSEYKKLEHIVQAREPEPAAVAEPQAQTPPPPPDDTVEELLVKLVRKVCSTVSNSDFTSSIMLLAEVIGDAARKTGIIQTPQASAHVSHETVDLNPPQRSSLFPTHRPKVIILGLLDGQATAIDNEFRKRYKLYFRKDQLGGELPDADFAITVKFTSHSMTRTLETKYRSDQIIHVHGGMTQLRSILNGKRLVASSNGKQLVGSN